MMECYRIRHHAGEAVEMEGVGGWGGDVCR